jgi:quercetin dioxygenase-like cupin family protein
MLDGVVVVDELTDARTVGEGIEANLETTLTAGQYFVLPPGVGGEVRNDGEETAIVSVAGILPSGMVTTTATPEN